MLRGNEWGRGDEGVARERGEGAPHDVMLVSPDLTGCGAPGDTHLTLHRS